MIGDLVKPDQEAFLGPGPLLVRANNAIFLMDFPTGAEKLYASDLEVRRGKSQPQFFPSILFAEGPSVAIIYGVEFEDGYPTGLARDFALKQQAFIHFLRRQNGINEELLGSTYRLFSSSQYSSELVATRAYLAARKSPLDAGVGYFDSNAQQYVRLVVGPD